MVRCVHRHPGPTGSNPVLSHGAPATAQHESRPLVPLPSTSPEAKTLGACDSQQCPPFGAPIHPPPPLAAPIHPYCNPVTRVSHPSPILSANVFTIAVNAADGGSMNKLFFCFVFCKRYQSDTRQGQGERQMGEKGKRRSEGEEVAGSLAATARTA